MRKLTILICTHDREQLLAKAVASLNSAARPVGWELEILVAANACRDGTHTFLASYQRSARDRGDLPMRWLAEPVPGKSNALNTALTHVDGDVIAFVDDDHRVHANYLTAICKAAEAHPETDLFCGRILPDWDGSEPQWVHDNGPYRVYPLPVPRFDQGEESRELTADIAIPGGGNLVVRTPWIGRIGRFSTEMGPTGHDLGGAEDLDWVLRGLRMGARLRYVPDLVQYHYVDASRLTLPYLMKKAYKRTESTVGLDAPKATGRVPRYLYRKLFEYSVKAGTALNSARRRFYLVRSAAALGELAGHWRLRRRKLAESSARAAVK